MGKHSTNARNGKKEARSSIDLRKSKNDFKMISAATRAVVIPSRVLARSFTHQTWISGPPRTRISFAEKVAHGLLISVCVMFTPMYIMSNLKSYRGKE